MKLKTFLSLMLVPLLLAGCEKPEYGNDQGLLFSTDRDQVELEYLSGSSARIEVATQAQFFKIFSSTDGVNVSTVSTIEVINGEIKKNNYVSANKLKYTLTATETGYTLDIAAQAENGAKTSVVEYYVLSTADRTAPLRVQQNGKGEFVEITREFLPEGGAVEVALRAQTGATITVSRVAGGEWLGYNYDATAGKLTLTAPFWGAEDGASDRDGVLRILNTDQGMVELKVTQRAPYIRLDKTMVLVRNENIEQEVNVTTNLPQGTIQLSDKFEAEDPDNRITATALSYADPESRNAQFTVNVNVDELEAGLPITAKYKVEVTGAAAALTAIEPVIAISRSQVLLDECFEYEVSSLYDAWKLTKTTGKDAASFVLNPSALSYADAAGTYVLSGRGKAMQRNYYMNGAAIDLQQTSPEYAPQTTGVVYMSFIFKLESLPYRDDKETNNHAMQYPVLGLSDAGTSRTVMCWVGKPLNEQTYRFGVTLASTDGTKVVWSEQTFSDLSKTHLLVLKYNVVTKRADLYVDPALTVAEPSNPSAYIDLTTNNPFNDTNSTVRIKSLFCFDNVKNGRINSQIGGIRVGKAWDESVAIQ